MKTARLAAACLTLFTTAANAATATRGEFGALADGTKIEAVTLANDKGMSARIITLGATLQAVIVPDKNGRKEDVTLGYDKAQDYLTRPNYFGVSVGRYANRIAKASFALDGKTYKLAANDGPNSLHGGTRGFDKRVWTIENVTSGPDARVTLSYISADGEEGFPGQLRATVTYTLNEQNELQVDYGATTSKPTVVNLTNHAYFNLSGNAARDVMGHLVTLKAERFTPVDPTLIPTGERRPVAGTPFDFRKPTAIGARIRDASNAQLRIGRGYDHNFIVDGKAGDMRTAAIVEDPVSGRVMEVRATAPGIQFYTGNFMDGTYFGKNNRAYRQGDALCLEPGTFPNAPNNPGFPSARLNPGQAYFNSMVFAFRTR
jgi:aldose 1-epimerase